MEWNNCTTWEDVARMTAEAIGKQIPKKSGRQRPGLYLSQLRGERAGYALLHDVRPEAVL